MKRTRLALIVCGVTAGLVALGGCGGGSSLGGSSAVAGGSGELTRAEWVAATDDVCRRDQKAKATREAEFGALLNKGLETPKMRAEAAEIIRDAIPTVEVEVAGVSALTPPAADEAKATRVIEELETTLVLDAKFADALERGSVTELELVAQEVQENSSALQRLAKGLGLRVCGRPEDSE